MDAADVTSADVAKAPTPYTAHPVQVESLQAVFNRTLATNCKVRAVTDTVHTQSGRTLAYAQTGQPDGVPLFYFHGIPGSRLDFEQPFNRPALEDTVVRIIGIDRPGYGGSDSSPRRAPSVRNRCQQVDEQVGKTFRCARGGSGGQKFHTVVAAGYGSHGVVGHYGRDPRPRVAPRPQSG